MLMRTDPFRDLDRLTQQVFGTVARPAAMPMDAYRKGTDFYVHFDLPGDQPGLDRPGGRAERAHRQGRADADRGGRSGDDRQRTTGGNLHPPAVSG